MNKLVKISLSGGAECPTLAWCLQEAILTMPERDSRDPGSLLFARHTLYEQVPESTMYLLKDEQGRVLECRGDIDLLAHPSVWGQVEPLVTGSCLAWMPYENIIDIRAHRISAVEREPVPPS